MRLSLPFCVGLFVVPLAPIVRADAQTGEQRAFTALRASHVGALTPIMTPAMISRTLNGAQLGIRYGLRDESGVRTQSVAVAGMFGIGLESSFSLHAGVSDQNCVGCSPALMLGVGGDMRVVERGDAIGSGSTLSIAVSGDLGYAQLKPGTAYALGLGIGAPMTLSFGAATQGMRIAPYFTPVFGVGSTSGACPVGFSQCEDNSIRWILGGGIGAWNPLSSVSATLGINQVMITGARPVFGINVIIGGR